MKTQEIKREEKTVLQDEVRRKYEELTKLMIHSGITITTMESCTAGQVASLITDTEGSSAILKGAFVTYSNEAKILQGVPAGIIREYGVYSPETSRAMAEACRKAYQADLGVGITGSFGNVDPDNADSIPGEVFFSVAEGSGTRNYHCHVPFQPARLSYKFYMADVIADVLLKLVQEKSGK